MKHHKNEHVMNPQTGTTCFGVMPEIDHKLYRFPEGEILLSHGEHRNANRGFGAKHIWAEHEKDISSLGYTTEEDVASYVADILQENSKIYCEFAGIKNERLAIVQSSVGMAILEHRYDGQNNTYYSVVTAFPRKRPYGQMIGRL